MIHRLRSGSSTDGRPCDPVPAQRLLPDYQRRLKDTEVAERYIIGLLRNAYREKDAGNKPSRQAVRLDSRLITQEINHAERNQ